MIFGIVLSCSFSGGASRLTAEQFKRHYSPRRRDSVVDVATTCLFERDNRSDRFSLAQSGDYKGILSRYLTVEREQ